MSAPPVIDLPHRLGAAEARRRIAGGIGRLADHLPPGAETSSEWRGDCLHLTVRALGQEVGARIEVMEEKVRLELLLPAMLSFFAGGIERLVRTRGAELLEDRSGRR